MKTRPSIILCLLSGLALGFAQPFFMPQLFGPISSWQHFLGLLSLIGYVPLFIALAHKNLKTTFGLAFLSLTLQYTIIFYWMYIALTVHGHIPPFLSCIITLMVPMALSVIVTTFLTMGQFLAQRYNLSFFFMAPLALCAADYFRNFYLFGGFPWGNAGYSIGQMIEFLQISALVGVYGLVFMVALINAFFAQALVKRSVKYGVLALAVIGLMYAYGATRLQLNQHEYAPSIRVAVLQGNIEQEVKRNAKIFSDDIVLIYKDLHEQALAQGAKLIVWPESSYPRVLNEDLKNLGLSFTFGAGTILGAVAYGKDAQAAEHHVRNAAFLANYDNRIITRYDKSHLVPFGEYVPWPLTEVVDKIVPGLGAFLPGRSYEVSALTYDVGKSIKVGTTVCYEGIFPEISRRYKNNGAEILINITNDAWYGWSSAPYQHLHMYRMRATEVGLSFVRATNSGISAIVDPYGRIKNSLPLFERGLIVADVSLINKATLYAAVGDIIPIACLLLMLIAYIVALVPIHQFIKQRDFIRLAIVLVFFLVVLGSHIYFSQPQFLTDESAATKNFLVFLIALLVLMGCLVRTQRSKTILRAGSIAIIIASAALTIVSSYYFISGIVIGLLIYILAFSIKVNNQPTKIK